MYERPLADTSPDVLAAVELLKEYGADMTHESRKLGRQQENTPVRVFTIPSLGGAQVALRMNKSKTTIYVRGTSVSGRDIEAELHSIGAVSKRYTGSEDYQAPSSLTGPHALYLKPSKNNVLIKIDTAPGAFRKVFEAALGPISSRSTSSSESRRTGPPRRTAVSLRTLLEQLDRRSDTGMRGEVIAIEYEQMRLQALTPPCPSPNKYVRQTSIEDVSAGYDIESSWPGSERFIEVKATTTPGADFYLSENERQVLVGLGDQGWILSLIHI